MFFLNKTYYEPLLTGVIERGIPLRTWSYARVDTVRDRYLDLFKKAGVDWLAVGIESADQIIRREVSKGSFQVVNIYDVVKRIQAAYNSALVAQGAFSAYWTEDVQAVGGWPDAIGEDIVLTWALLGTRGIVQYEPVALGFTHVPERLGQLLSQRSRWARGMLEGLRTHPPPRQPRVLAKFVAGIDYLVPFLDIGLIFFWVPGVILFLFGYPLIFGWWSMLLLPITLVIFGFLQRWQARHVFRTLDIHPQADKRGFLGYLFAYQVLTSAAALRGYGQYIAGAGRRWR
jgi:biofilm PGA synthesis N-glycosyltransferase PgaC